jgi:hypothetical protein
MLWKMPKNLLLSVFQSGINKKEQVSKLLVHYSTHQIAT